MGGVVLSVLSFAAALVVVLVLGVFVVDALFVVVVVVAADDNTNIVFTIVVDVVVIDAVVLLCEANVDVGVSLVFVGASVTLDGGCGATPAWQNSRPCAS